MKNSIDFKEVEHILLDQSGSLRRLAQVAGFDEFSFYRHADLCGVDLSGQNLRGMNFDGADLRGANLDNVQFTLGAFNGSKLSSEYFELVDEFDSYMDDVFVGTRMTFMFYGRMRAETIEAAIEFSGLNYGQFCDEAGISELTLRRARREESVANTTLLAICKTLNQYMERVDNLDLFGDVERIVSPAAQPFIQLLSLRNEGGFDTIEQGWFALFRERFENEISMQRLFRAIAKG